MSTSSSRDSIFFSTLRVWNEIQGGALHPHWMEDGNSFWWREDSLSCTKVWAFDPIKQAKTVILSSDHIRTALSSAKNDDLADQSLVFSNFEFLPGEQLARITFDSKTYLYDIESRAITLDLSESETEKDRQAPRLVREGDLELMPAHYEKLSSDGRWFAGSKAGNLYRRSRVDDRSEILTEDGVEEDCEWLIEDAIWAPKGSLLFAVKADRRNVPLYPIVHWLGASTEIEYVRRGYAGAGSAKTECYVIDTDTRDRVRIDVGKAAVRVRGWRQDGSELLLTVLNDARTLDFLAADPMTGRTRLLFRETTETFFDLAVNLPNSPNFTPLNDNHHFLWLSERDGWNHIYLYSLDGTYIRRLTHGQRPVARVVAIDETDGWVYYTAFGVERRQYDLHLYRVPLEGGEPTRLTEELGQHDMPFYLRYLGLANVEGIQFSPSRRFFLDTHSDVDRAPRTELHHSDGRLIEVLSVADADGAKALRQYSPEEFCSKAADGQTDLYGLIYKPTDFEPNKKYPVVDSIYAGPQMAWVSRAFASSAGTLAQAVANLGIIVLTVDARGTPHRGKRFQDFVYGNFGRNEIADHVAVLKQLVATRPYMDITRIGVFGGSFGGYFALRAMLQAPDVYRVGVAVAPISDLRQVDGVIIYFRGPPNVDSEAYEYASNLRMVDKLVGRLLTIHGTSDVNVPLSSTMQLIDALMRSGKPYDLVLLPDQGHVPTGAARVYYLNCLKNYFVQYLLECPPSRGIAR